MSTVQIAHYPFDFHTHFWGILPTRCKTPSFSHTAPAKTPPIPTPSLETAVGKYYAFVAGLTMDQLQAPAKDAPDQRETILTDAASVKTPFDVKRRLFALAMSKAQKTLGSWVNLSDGFSAKVSFSDYLRGECFVENAMIAAWLLARDDRPYSLADVTSVSALEEKLKTIEALGCDNTFKDLDRLCIKRIFAGEAFAANREYAESLIDTLDPSDYGEKFTNGTARWSAPTPTFEQQIELASIPSQLTLTVALDAWDAFDAMRNTGAKNSRNNSKSGLSSSAISFTDPNIFVTDWQRLFGDYPCNVPALAPYFAPLKFYDCFNELFYSASPFTPFDDSYVARDSLKDLPAVTLSDGKTQVSLQHFLIEETRLFYAHSGTQYSQLSMGIPKKGAPMDQVLSLADSTAVSVAGKEVCGDWGLGHKVLCHNTDHAEGKDPTRLAAFLDASIDAFNGTDWQSRAVGCDFLGAERIIDFETLLSVFVATERSNPITPKSSSPAAATDKQKFTFRIHFGEGCGIDSDNRSVFGHLAFMTSASDVLQLKNPTFKEFCDHLQNYRGPQATVFPDVTDLMPRVFSGPYQDLRFNIFSAKTQEKTRAIAETNMMGFFHAATAMGPDGNYLYQKDGPAGQAFKDVVFRLGHGYHARHVIHGLSQISDLPDAFQKVAFDTNLGSNFITGSSAEFTSMDDYKRAEGIRKLTSYAPTQYVMRAIDAVFGTSSLSDALFRGDAFPLLLGSDGEGVEHTELERESIRAFMLSVLRGALQNQFLTNKDVLQPDNLKQLQVVPSTGPAVVQFVHDYAERYWQQTVGPVLPVEAPPVVIIAGGAWITEQRVEPIASGTASFSYTKAPEFDITWGGIPPSTPSTATK